METESFQNCIVEKLCFMQLANRLEAFWECHYDNNAKCFSDSMWRIPKVIGIHSWNENLLWKERSLKNQVSLSGFIGTGILLYTLEGTHLHCCVWHPNFSSFLVNMELRWNLEDYWHNWWHNSSLIHPSLVWVFYVTFERDLVFSFSASHAEDLFLVYFLRGRRLEHQNLLPLSSSLSVLF